MSDWQSKIGRLRLVGLLEGVSFLVLLGVAMPVKYLLGQPLAVRLVGSAHGALFLAFVYFLGRAARAHGWPWQRTLVAFLASLVPLGPFLLDRRLKAEQLGDAPGAPPSASA